MDDKKIELKLEGTTLYVTLGFELTVTNSDALKDVNHHGVGGFLLLGQIDVTGVISLVVASIVHILELL